MKNIIPTMSICLSLAVTSSLTACTKCSKDESASKSTLTGGAATGTTSSEVKELKIETMKEGSGAMASAGKKVTVHYTGTLIDGKVFDSSETRKSPFTFTLGEDQVIPGWEKGVDGMKIGERRKLTIPASLAYGERGVGNIIPQNATLVFEVELLNVE